MAVVQEREQPFPAALQVGEEEAEAEAAENNIQLTNFERMSNGKYTHSLILRFGLGLG